MKSVDFSKKDGAGLHLSQPATVLTAFIPFAQIAAGT
jgi:hypothetical protein